MICKDLWQLIPFAKASGPGKHFLLRPNAKRIPGGTVFMLLSYPFALVL